MSRPSAGAPFVPSLILGEVYPQAIRRPHDIANAVSTALTAGFFRRFELPASLDREESARLMELRADASIGFTCWASEAIAKDKLDLCSTSEAQRQHAVDQLRRVGERAAAYGADRLGLITASDPGESQRPEARAQLVKSLIELGNALARDARMKVALEPLDRGAHKNGFIGPIDEAVALIREVREQSAAVFIGWDSGHAALNGENVIDSLRAAAPVSCQVHLSNPVTDRSDVLYGDYHYPIGAVGVGTVAQFSEIMGAALAADFPEPVSVAVEVRTQGAMTPPDTLKHCAAILRQVMPRAASELESA